MEADRAEHLVNAFKQLGCPENVEVSMFYHLFDNPELANFLEKFITAVECKEIGSTAENEPKNETYNESKEAYIQELKQQVANLKLHKQSLEQQEKCLEIIKSDQEIRDLEEDYCKKQMAEYISSLKSLTSTELNSDSESVDNEQNIIHSVKSYLALEQTHLNDMHGYIKKQFQKKIGTAASTETETKFDPNEITSIETKNPIVQQWQKETLRLKQALFVSQKNLLWAKSTRMGQQEGLAYMEQQKLMPNSLTDIEIQAKQLSLNEKLEEAKLELELARIEIDSKSEKIVDGLLVSVLSGNYDLKIKRQEYFLTKQIKLLEFLLNQMSRLSFLHILLQILVKKKTGLQDGLKDLNEDLDMEIKAIEKRKIHLENLIHCEDSDIVSDDDKVMQSLSKIIGKDDEIFFTTHEYLKRSGAECLEANEMAGKTLAKLDLKIAEELTELSANFGQLFNETKRFYGANNNNCLGFKNIKKMLDKAKTQIGVFQNQLVKYHGQFNQQKLLKL